DNLPNLPNGIPSILKTPVHWGLLSQKTGISYTQCIDLYKENPMSSELYEQIVSQRGSLESLAAKIPGFKGYQEKQARRTADRLLRERLASEIDTHLNRFGRIQNDLLD